MQQRRLRKIGLKNTWKNVMQESLLMPPLKKLVIVVEKVTFLHEADIHYVVMVTPTTTTSTSFSTLSYDGDH